MARLATALTFALVPPSLMAQATPQTTPAQPAIVAPAETPASAPLPSEAASAPRLSEEERARRRAARDAPMQAQWALIINAPDRLRELLMRHLDVARFRSELASETTSLRELTRLVGADRKSVV